MNGPNFMVHVVLKARGSLWRIDVEQEEAGSTGILGGSSGSKMQDGRFHTMGGCHLT